MLYCPPLLPRQQSFKIKEEKENTDSVSHSCSVNCFTELLTRKRAEAREEGEQIVNTHTHIRTHSFLVNIPGCFGEIPNPHFAVIEASNVPHGQAGST